MSAKKKPDTDAVMSELGGSAFFQPPTSPQADIATGTQTHKPTSTQNVIATSGQTDITTKPLVEKYTTHLEPEIVKWVKVYAAQHDMKDYEVVQAAIVAYREQHQD